MSVRGGRPSFVEHRLPSPATELNENGKIGSVDAGGPHTISPGVVLIVRLTQRRRPQRSLHPPKIGQAKGEPTLETNEPEATTPERGDHAGASYPPPT